MNFTDTDIKKEIESLTTDFPVETYWCQRVVLAKVNQIIPEFHMIEIMKGLQIELKRKYNFDLFQKGLDYDPLFGSFFITYPPNLNNFIRYYLDNWNMEVLK